MAWFITDVDPALRVRVDDHRTVVFVAGEYRTNDAAEVAALRQDGRVGEAFEIDWRQDEAVVAVQREGYAVNANTGELHDLSQAGTRCHIPNGVETATGWKVYKRMSDALRWNRGMDLCGFCMKEG